MNKLNKTHGLLVLFTVLILVLVINPSFIKNMYSSILGRILLVFIVLFFAMNNMTLGLLVAMIFIVFSNLLYANENTYTKEGLDNMDTTTPAAPSAGAAAVAATPTTAAPAAMATPSTMATTDKKKVQPAIPGASNIDLETIKNSIQSKPSSSLPTATPGSSDDVTPATKESFQSMYGSF
jgi:type IV secretory pathway TrbL component